jgi:hypothetical protein
MFWCSARLSQPKGAEGLRPPQGAIMPPCVPRRATGTEAATAKNCGIGKRDSTARTARPAIGTDTAAKMPHCAASAVRRLALAEEAKQVALPEPPGGQVELSFKGDSG